MAAFSTMAIAASIAAVAAVANTAYSVHQGEMQKKKQKGQAEDQQRAIAEQEAKALSDRKQKIDQMRSQMAGTGTGTRGYSTSGIQARIGSSSGNNILG